MMDFRIETFIVVCRYMNFTKAAEELNITQPAVSQHVHYLEEFYRAKLFTYEGKKMYLTKAGEILYQAAITMKHDDQYLRKIIRELNENKKRLFFGATLTIGEFVMIEHLESYLNLYPETEVKMAIGNTHDLLNKLRSGEIDFAIVEGNFVKSEYDYLFYSNERYLPVCGIDYKFQKEPKKLVDLLSERIIIREKGSGTREILENYLETRNMGIEDFRNHIEIGGINAIKSLVETGCGITFVYEAAVKKELKSGLLKEIMLEDFQVYHDFAFIWNKGSAFSKDFLEICSVLSGGYSAKDV